MKLSVFAKSLAALACFGVAALGGQSAPGKADTADTVQPAPTQLIPRYTVRPYKNFNAALEMSRPPTAQHLQLWSKTVLSLGSHYTYSMVGKSPFLAASGKTSINVWVIPVKIAFPADHVTFDANAPDPCAGNLKPYVVLEKSPMFTKTTFKIGQTDVGGGPSQFANAYQRANYYKVLANTAGYGIDLVVKNGLTATFHPTNPPHVIAQSCGKLGFIDINEWDGFAQAYINAHSAQMGPSALPLFVFDNVTMYDGSVNNCCILGYHGAYANPKFGGAMQTYGNTVLMSGDIFGVDSMDSAVASHEIIEWLADPSGTNPTPAWGHIGQVPGCQDNLEPGDPLSGTSFKKALGGRIFHIQDEAFTSWFYRQKPSTAIAGRYSYNGTFKTDAGAVCF